MSLHSERSHWTTDSVGFSVDDRNVVRSVSAGSFAQEAGLSPGDEIISVGDEMISRSSHSSHLMTVIKRQNTFPPSICVVSRVKFATIYVGESEEMGIEVEEYYESEIEEARKTPAILLKSVEKYSPAYRANLRTGDQLTHIGGLTVNTVDLVPYMLRQHSKGGTLILGYLPATRSDYRRSSLPRNLGDLSQNGILHLLSEGRDSRSTIKLAKEILSMIEKYNQNQDHVELLTKVNPKLATHPRRREIVQRIIEFLPENERQLWQRIHERREVETKGDPDSKYESVIDVPYESEDGIRLAFQVAKAYREENHEKIQLYGQELCEVLSNYPDLYDIIWDEISYLMGREAAADIQGFYPNKIEIILKKEEAAEPEKIPLSLRKLHFPLKVNEMVDIFNRLPEHEIIDCILTADTSMTKADLEILWKLVNYNEILETVTCRTSKAFRVRIERFRKYLQNSALFEEKILLMLHRFYFEELSDQLLADLNYTFRVVKEIVDFQKRLTPGAEETAKVLRKTSDLHRFCRTRQNLTIRKMKVKEEEARRKLNKIVKLDRSQNNQIFKQILNEFLNSSKQKLDAILLLQVRIQDSMDRRSLFQFCEDNKRVLEDALERYL